MTPSTDYSARMIPKNITREHVLRAIRTRSRWLSNTQLADHMDMYDCLDSSIGVRYE